MSAQAELASIVVGSENAEKRALTGDVRISSDTVRWRGDERAKRDRSDQRLIAVNHEHFVVDPLGKLTHVFDRVTRADVEEQGRHEGIEEGAGCSLRIAKETATGPEMVLGRAATSRSRCPRRGRRCRANLASMLPGGGS